MEMQDLVLSGVILGLFLFMIIFIIMNMGKSEKLHLGLPFFVLASLFIIWNAYNQGEVVSHILENLGM